MWNRLNKLVWYVGSSGGAGRQGLRPLVGLRRGIPWRRGVPWSETGKLNGWLSLGSPFSSARKVRPPRQPIKVSTKASDFFQSLVASNESAVAIRVGYKQSKGSLSMVYSFDFMGKADVDEAESRRPPDERLKLDSCSVYIDPSALMKVMGATVDVDLDSFKVQLLDPEGHPLEP